VLLNRLLNANVKTALTELIEKWDSEMGSYIPNAPIYQSLFKRNAFRKKNNKL
jgi:hypothetical protein